MGERLQQFRDWARNCLNLAVGARFASDRQMLEDMAADLELETKRIENRLSRSGPRAAHDPKLPA